MIRLASIVCLALSAGCTATGDEVRPDPGAFYFPNALATSSVDGVADDLLFVGNANSDLRFDSGALNAVDLTAVGEVVDAWIGDQSATPEGCEQDPELPGAITCDERQFILGQGDRTGDAARIGNFITDIKVQRLTTGNYRLFTAVRGDPSITYVDFDRSSNSLACSADEGFDRCDDEHRLIRLFGDSDISIPSEPFQLHVDGEQGYAIVSHLSGFLTDPVVSLVDAPTDGMAPTLSDSVGGLFSASPLSGEVSAVGVAGRNPGQPDDLIYVTSRLDAIVRTLVVTEVGDRKRLLDGPSFSLARVRDSDDARDLTFGQGGNRAYIINRDPPALHVIDSSLGQTGLPKNELLRAVPLCAQPSRLALAEVEGRELAFVTCFRDNEVWAVDPDAGVPLAFTLVGRGPHAITPVRHAGGVRLYVGNTLEDTVSVVELQRGQFENRVVMKIGRTRQSEAN